VGSEVRKLGWKPKSSDSKELSPVPGPRSPVPDPYSPLPTPHSLFSLLAATVLSALAFTLVLPNEFFLHGFPLGGFFCLIPYFYALRQSDSLWKGAVLGFVFGVLFHGTSSWWLANFKDYALWTLGATSLLYGIFYGFWAIFLRYAARAGSKAEPFLIALVWTIMEWQKSNGYFAFPWGLLPYTVQSVPALIQTADASGVYGPGFLLALCNAAFAEMIWTGRRTMPAGFRSRIFQRFSPALVAAFVLLVFTLGYGAWCLRYPVPAQRTIPLVLVQHSSDQYGDEGQALTGAIDLSRQGTAYLRAQGKEPAMIVWSETTLTMPYRGNSFFASHPVVPFLEQSTIPILTGAPLVPTAEPAENSKPDDYMPEIANGTILVQRGRITDSYAKRQLIPFAESIPFGSEKWMRRLMEKFAGFSSGWTAGKEAVVMEIPGLRFGTPICFEDAFAGNCRDFIKKGAELLVNLTNDSWSQTSSAEVQHLAAARFRTVENRRTLVRSTNSGCTVVMDAQGRTIAALPMFTPAYLAVDVPVELGGPTPYFLYGDWLPILCAILFTVRMFRHWNAKRGSGEQEFFPK